MKPPKHLPKPVRKTGGARATKLSDQMANPTVEFAASQAAHFDNYSVEQFAYAMRIKLAVKRQEGRGGWQDKEFCSGEFLSHLLREHVEKGDPVDVANFCMMLHQRGERITPDANSHIPGDIEAAATAAIKAAQDEITVDRIESSDNHSEMIRTAFVGAVSSAILAERQRCAQIASNEAVKRLDNQDGYPAARVHDFMVVARAIERNIRRGDTARLPARSESSQ